MSEPKFTLGPWTCLGPSFGDPLPRYTTVIETDWEYEDAENREICEMPLHHHDEENEANANLIAAGPVLYAELQNIANADPTKWDEDTRDQFQQWAQSRARAALAKARGEG